MPPPVSRAILRRAANVRVDNGRSPPAPSSNRTAPQRHRPPVGRLCPVVAQRVAVAAPPPPARYERSGPQSCSLPSAPSSVARECRTVQQTAAVHRWAPHRDDRTGKRHERRSVETMMMMMVARAADEAGWENFISKRQCILYSIFYVSVFVSATIFLANLRRRTGTLV